MTFCCKNNLSYTIFTNFFSGTKIELCEAKDHSLTILITGKRSQVNEARNRLVRELQTQASVEVAIPKEYHGHIIGEYLNYNLTFF